jgi:Na+/H+-dicarboxylate symporter
MIQVLVFSILAGVAIGMVKNKVPVILSLLEQTQEALTAMLRIVLSLSPYGIFALMAFTTGTMGLQVLLPLGIYLVGIAIACLFMIFIVCGALVAVIAKVSPVQFFKHTWDSAIMAFSTQSSAAALPLQMEAAAKMGIKREIFGFTLPLGSMNQDGTALYQAFATVLIAQFYGVDLSFGQQFVVLFGALLASSGSFAIPGAGLITLSIVLKSVGLPLEGIALVAGVDRIADMFRTCLNVVDDMACTVAVASTEPGGFDRDVFYGRKEASEEAAA